MTTTTPIYDALCNLSRSKWEARIYCSWCQPLRKSTSAPIASLPDHVASLAETGHCSEALPLLAKTAAHLADRELRKRVGVDGVRWATLLKQQEPLLGILRVLSQHFPHDIEVLYLYGPRLLRPIQQRRAGTDANVADIDSRALNGCRWLTGWK